MKNAKILSTSLFLLFVWTVLGGAVATSQNRLSEGTLSYPPRNGTGQRSLVLKSPRGEAYRLSLEAERDVSGRVGVLDLVLQRKNDKEDYDANLLDTTGKLHGYQPYFFAAPDFVHGAQESAYGEIRTMEVPRLGMEVQVKVIRVIVEQGPADVATPATYQFTNLNLQVVMRPLPGRTRPK